MNKIFKPGEVIAVWIEKENFNAFLSTCVKHGIKCTCRWMAKEGCYLFEVPYNRYTAEFVK